MKHPAVTVRASHWGTQDGTQVPIVRVLGGRNTVAVSYDDLPRVISELARLLHEHQAPKEGEREDV